jgi:hypothetical protein
MNTVTINSNKITVFYVSPCANLGFDSSRLDDGKKGGENPPPCILKYIDYSSSW